MGVQILGVDGATIAAIDADHMAQRTSIRPQQCVAWSSIGTTTGLLTGATMVAGATLFSLRNAGANRVLVRRVQISWLTTTLGAAGRFDFGLSIARSFANMDTGGSTITLTARHRVGLNAPTVNAMIAGAAAMTAGAGRTLDGVAGVAGYWSAAIGSQLPQTSLLSHDAGDHPIVLGTNEGIVLSALAVAATTAVSLGYVNVELVEALAYP